MGTSSSYGGPSGGTPLIPSWLGPTVVGGGNPPAPSQDGTQGPATPPSPASPPTPPSLPPIPPAASSDRFRTARGGFTRFARSGGGDRVNMGRAISNYVSSSAGGHRAAAQRMGASRTSGANLVSFLSNVTARGVTQALRDLNLGSLAGRPVEEIFLGMMDHVCPPGGTIDEAISREAFIETIADLAENGITDLNSLTPDQMQVIFELYVAHAIETRLCNDIGMNAIMLPSDHTAAARLQEQLFDFVRGGVSDAITAARNNMQALTPDRVQGFVTHIYEQAYFILQTLGEAEAEQE